MPRRAGVVVVQRRIAPRQAGVPEHADEPAVDHRPPEPEFADPLYGLFALVSNLAESTPLVLAIDDLHWLDEKSGRFVAYLASRLEGLAIPDRPSAGPTQLRKDSWRLTPEAVNSGISIVATCEGI